MVDHGWSMSINVNHGILPGLIRDVYYILLAGSEVDMVLQWARAKEEIDLGKTMKGAQPKTFLQAVCFDMKGCNANGRWLQRPKQENQAPSQHSQA